ncbi:MAG TPA: hypothetical protein VM734_21380 [Kofleriaceae bacterium]|jgi:hypothetical protein|nr:hypothetical protein [Kofleriaceae bacterium]
MKPLAMVLAAALAAGACGDTTYRFDGTTVGEDDGTDRTLRSKTSSQFVRGLYADLVGRAPERYDFEVRSNGAPAFVLPIDEEAYLVNTLDGMGDPAPIRALVVKGLVESAEVDLPIKSAVGDPAGFIRDQFRRLLGREPNAYELGAFVAAWKADPAVGPKAIVRALAGSREYQAK